MRQPPSDNVHLKTPSPADTPPDWRDDEVEAAGHEQSLRRLLVEQGVMPWQEVVRIGMQVATQLDSFHKRGVCPHGAVCPENILLTASGGDYVLGLPVVGAPEPYRAPETYRRPQGAVADARADVFSLGVVLFEALAGNRTYPFRLLLPEQGAVGHAPSFLPDHDLGSLAPGVPLQVRHVIEQAVRLVPDNRFESALAFADALRSAAAESESRPRAKARSAKTALRAHRRRWPVVLAMVGTLCVFAAALFLLFRPPSARLSQETQRMREEALELSAATLVPELWRAAEDAHGQWVDAAARTDLYRRARDGAWQKRLEQVALAAQRASAFDATGEAAFARANDAKERAEHLWQARRLSDALKSLAEAEEFYLAALKNRRERWVDAIRAQLAQEKERTTGSLRAEDEERIQALRSEILNLLGSADPSPQDLRAAEGKVVELRHETAAALERAGKQAAARQRASEAVARAESALRSAEKAAQAFPTLLSTWNRGKEFLDAAGRAADEDPSQAVTLAEEATQRFRQVESAAEKELARYRQLASSARRRARAAEAPEAASATYRQAEEAWQRGEQRERDWLQRKTAYEQAKAAFEQALEEAQQAAVAAIEPPALAPENPPAPAAAPPESKRTAPQIATPPAVVAVPTAPPLAPVPPAAKIPVPERKQIQPLPQEGPMPADLAASIRMWLRDTCENLNRTLARSGSGRARCEELVVLDRRDRSQVSVTYSLAQGTVVPEGIQWGAAVRRSATLDCTSTSCRCVAGDGC